MKEYFIDLGIMNAIAAMIAFIAYLGGHYLLDVFVLLLFLECGVLLILGGLFGFLFTGAFYYSLKKIITGEKPNSGKNMKTEITTRQSRGKNITIVGFALLLESIIISLLI